MFAGKIRRYKYTKISDMMSLLFHRIRHVIEDWRYCVMRELPEEPCMCVKNCDTNGSIFPQDVSQYTQNLSVGKDMRIIVSRRIGAGFSGPLFTACADIAGH